MGVAALLYFTLFVYLDRTLSVNVHMDCRVLQQYILNVNWPELAEANFHLLSSHRTHRLDNTLDNDNTVLHKLEKKLF